MQMEALRYFLAAYDRRSYAAAAKSIPMTARGLIKAVRNLEDELGTRLFIVGSTGELVPTKEADRFAVYARNALTGLAQMMDDFSALPAGAQRERLRVGLPNGMSDVLGRLFWEDFEREHPEVACVLEEVPDLVVEDRLETGFYDVAITVTPFNERFVTEPLVSLELGMWVNVDNPVYEAGQVCFDDLRDNVLFTVGAGYKTFETIMRECLRRGIEPLRVVTSGQLFRIFHAVASNLGLGTTVRSAADHPFFQHSKVAYLPFEGLGYTAGISYVAGTELTDGARALIRHARAAVAGKAGR